MERHAFVSKAWLFSKNMLIDTHKIFRKINMQAIDSIDEIHDNCFTILSYLSEANSENRSFAEHLIAAGTCFLPVYVDEKLLFCPSRFIGYHQNNRTMHTTSEKDGRQTNKWISRVLNHTPAENAAYESQYVQFCSELGFAARPTGSFGVKRKYWNVPLDPTEFSSSIIDIISIKDNPNIPTTERQQLMMARIGQGNFRKSLIAEWGRCSVSGCENEQLLRASHIKPWRLPNNQERLDPANGLLLIPNLDIAFDKYLVTFSPAGKIVISRRLSERDRNALSLSGDMTIPVSSSREKYLVEHRTIFEKFESDARV